MSDVPRLHGGFPIRLGADPANLARVQQQIASLQVTLPATIVATVQKAKSNRIL
jgi:hypothetical protein